MVSYSLQQQSQSTSASIRRILSLYDNYGESDYIGEPCSILSHSLQAGCLARDHVHTRMSNVPDQMCKNPQSNEGKEEREEEQINVNSINAVSDLPLRDIELIS